MKFSKTTRLEMLERSYEDIAEAASNLRYGLYCAGLVTYHKTNTGMAYSQGTALEELHELSEKVDLLLGHLGLKYEPRSGPHLVMEANDA